MHESAGVITFRIGDLGFVLRTPTLRAGSRFRIENTKTKFENYLRIPQSAFPNPQTRCSTTPNISPSLLAKRFNFVPVYSLVFPGYTIKRVGFGKSPYGPILLKPPWICPTLAEPQGWGTFCGGNSKRVAAFDSIHFRLKAAPSECCK
jgi:hypothetical protein